MTAGELIEKLKTVDPNMEVVVEAPDSVFVFQFDETDNHYETVSFVPTLNKAMVWRSLSSDNPYWNADEDADYGEEGAVNPNSGIARWEDELAFSLYPLNDWKNYHRPKVAL